MAAAIGLIYRDYFIDKESAQTQNKQMALFSLSQLQQFKCRLTLESLSPSAKQEGENDVIHSTPLPAENAIIFTDRGKMAAKTRGILFTAEQASPA